MYARQTRARPSPAAATAPSQSRSRLAIHARNVRGVVLAQRLDVADLEPGALGRVDDRGDVDQLAVGEHVPADEACAGRAGSRRTWRSRGSGAGRRDRAATAASRSTAAIAGRADVLEHADRRDRVEPLAAERPVVLQPDLHPVGDAGLAARVPAPRRAAAR